MTELNDAQILDAAVAVEAFEEYPSATAPFAPVRTRSLLVAALKRQATEIEAFVPAIEPQKAVGGQKGYVNDFIKKTVPHRCRRRGRSPARSITAGRYWTVGRFQVSTDDAYVKADNTTIAPKVAGYIAAVLVGDNEPVRAGQVLARIDDRDFRVALEQAKADVAAAEAAIADKQAALDAQQSVIEPRGPTVEVDEANDLRRTGKQALFGLASSGYGSVQNAQQAPSRCRRPGGGRARQAALDSRPQQIDVLKAETAQAEATLARDRRAQTRRSSISPTRRSLARSTAWSATARCASANTCRPERS